MMPLDKAIALAMNKCDFLYTLIEEKERRYQSLDAKHRSEFGCLRALMFAAGVPKDQLPETPYLEPAHLQNFRDRAEQAKREKGGKDAHL